MVGVMIKLKEISLSKLRNYEIPAMMKSVIDSLEIFDLEELHLQDMYKLLVLQNEAIEPLRAVVGKHLLTEELARLHTERLMYASLINENVKRFLNINDKKLRRDAVVARRLTKKHLTYLGQYKRDLVGYQLDTFFSIINVEYESPEKRALYALGLKNFVDELDKAHSEYEALKVERENDKKKKSRKDNPILRRDTLWLLRAFFDKVGANQRMYKDVDYSPLIVRLNIYLTAKSKTIKTRITINKKKKAQKLAESAKLEADKNKDIPSKATVKPTAKVKSKPKSVSSNQKMSKEKVAPKQASSASGTKNKPIDAKRLKRILKQPNKMGGKGNSS